MRHQQATTTSTSIMIQGLRIKYDTIVAEKMNKAAKDVKEIGESSYGKHNNMVFNTLKAEIAEACNKSVRVAFMAAVLGFLAKLSTYDIQSLRHELLTTKSKHLKDVVSFIDLYTGDDTKVSKVTKGGVEVVMAAPSVETVSVACGPDEPSKELTEIKEQLFPKNLTHDRPGYFESSSTAGVDHVYNCHMTKYQEELLDVISVCINDMRDLDDGDESIAKREYQDLPNYDEVSESMEPYVKDIEEIPTSLMCFEDKDEEKRFMRSIKFRLYMYSKEGQLPDRSEQEIPVTYVNVTRNANQVAFWSKMRTQTGYTMKMTHCIPSGSILSNKCMRSLCSSADDNVHIVNGSTEQDNDYFNIDNVLMLQEIEKEGRHEIWRDQYGVCWLIKKTASQRQIKEIEKDYKFLNLLGLTNKFSLPIVCREYTFNNETGNANSKNIMMFKIGMRNTLKTVEKKQLKRIGARNDEFREFCGAMGLVISSMNYNISKLKLTHEGKFLCPSMNGIRSIGASMTKGFTNEFFTTDKGRILTDKGTVLRLLRSCQFKRVWKTDREIFRNLRCDTVDFQMDYAVDNLESYSRQHLPSISNVKLNIYGEECMITTRNLTKYAPSFTDSIGSVRPGYIRYEGEDEIKDVEEPEQKKPVVRLTMFEKYAPPEIVPTVNHRHQYSSTYYDDARYPNLWRKSTDNREGAERMRQTLIEQGARCTSHKMLAKYNEDLRNLYHEAYNRSLVANKKQKEYYQTMQQIVCAVFYTFFS